MKSNENSINFGKIKNEECNELKFKFSKILLLSFKNNALGIFIFIVYCCLWFLKFENLKILSILLYLFFSYYITQSIGNKFNNKIANKSKIQISLISSFFLMIPLLFECIAKIFGKELFLIKFSINIFVYYLISSLWIYFSFYLSKFDNLKKHIPGITILMVSLCIILTTQYNYSKDMMLEVRYNPSITMLNDETVLITGGDSDSGKTLQTAEIYDPKTHKSHYVGNLNIKRVFHKGILLDDGRVLIIGGMSPGIYKKNLQAEIYDPKTKSFKLVKNENIVGISNFYLTKLNDGKIFLLGSSNVEIFDPKTEKFDFIGNTIGKQDNSSVAILPNGNLIILGVSYQKLSTEYFKSRNGLFSKPNRNAETIYLPNRRYYELGKYGNKFKKELWQTNSSEIYNTKTKAFSIGPQMHVEQRRAIHPVTLNDGSILVIGGEDTSAKPVSEVEIFNPKTNSFEFVGKMLFTRSDIEPVKLDNGLIYIVGGNYTKRESFLAGRESLNCEIYNPKTKKFKESKICSHILKYDYKPLLLKNGKLLLVGGGNPNLTKNQIKKIEIIDTRRLE